MPKRSNIVRSTTPSEEWFYIYIYKYCKYIAHTYQIILSIYHNIYHLVIQHSYWKSAFWMGQLTINGNFPVRYVSHCQRVISTNVSCYYVKFFMVWWPDHDHFQLRMGAQRHRASGRTSPHRQTSSMWLPRRRWTALNRIHSWKIQETSRWFKPGSSLYWK